MKQREISWLLAFGAFVAVCWALFSWFILPILPESDLTAGLAVLGYFAIFVVGGLGVYEIIEAIEDDEQE